MAVAFLLGVARTRLARSAVADLVTELGHSPAPGELRAALARALRDPSLEIAYWLPADERFVDSSGKPTAILREGDSQVVTDLVADGQLISRSTDS